MTQPNRSGYWAHYIERGETGAYDARIRPAATMDRPLPPSLVKVGRASQPGLTMPPPSMVAVPVFPQAGWDELDKPALARVIFAEADPAFLSEVPGATICHEYD